MTTRCYRRKEALYICCVYIIIPTDRTSILVVDTFNERLK